jgi:hypothetical protein
MTRTDSTPVTFLGPIRNFGAKDGKRSYGFLMLQSTGGEPIKLEYPDKLSAEEARATLLKMAWTFPVANLQLLYGIEKGLQHALMKGKTGVRPAE